VTADSIVGCVMMGGVSLFGLRMWWRWERWKRRQRIEAAIRRAQEAVEADRVKWASTFGYNVEYRSTYLGGQCITITEP